MKLKRWLSRGIVLAMVVALMVPMPVAAKSSKAGGKLVSSYTEFSWNANSNRWEKQEKVEYTYNAKGNPAKIATTEYTRHFLGVPVDQKTTTNTVKYKTKGKALKSMKMKNEAKSVVQSRKYSGGKAVNVMRTTYTSNFDETKKIEKVTVADSNTAYTYNKAGLVVSELGSTNWTYNDGTKPEVYYGAWNYAVTHSKGVPSLIQQIDGGSSWNFGGVQGQKAAVTYPEYYSLFNGQGLVIEEGDYTDKVAAAHEADRWVEYTMKKGKVTQAVVYELVEDANEKMVKTPVKRVTFKYGKKSISKVRYLSMINSIVGTENSVFTWF